MRLTDQGVRGLPFANSGQRDYPDEAFPGFSVRVGTRTKTFTVVLGTGANRKRYTLGRYDPPTFTLAVAREMARDIAAKDRLTPKSRKLPPTYREALKTFMATHSAQKHRPNTRKEVEGHHRRHFLPTLGEIRLTDIDTGDIVAILDEILSTPSEANHAFQHVRTFFRWAVKRRLIDRSPVEGLDRPATEVARSRVLTSDELVAVWRACERFSHFGPFVRALILTGQRRGQMAKLRGEMIDRQKQTITWPPEFMKSSKEHTIPYGPMLAKIVGGGPDIGLVLPSQRGHAFTDSGSEKRTFDRNYPVAHWTIHDLRRTWATISAEELDTPPHIIEAVLAHQSGTAVARIYNRARYLEPMRKAMIAFEEWLQTLLSNTEGMNAAELPGLHHERARAVE